MVQKLKDALKKIEQLEAQLNNIELTIHQQDEVKKSRKDKKSSKEVKR